MQAAQHSQGIQTLLEAEKEAAKIVQQARQCTLATASGPTILILTLDRVQRLKDARSEATKEIDEYRLAKESEFKGFEASVRLPHSALITHRSMHLQYAGNTTSAQAAVDRETEFKLQETTDVFEANKDAVIKKLLDRVVLIKPELHRNLKKLGGSEVQ